MLALFPALVRRNPAGGSGWERSVAPSWTDKQGIYVIYHLHSVLCVLPRI